MSKLINESNWFTARRLPSSYPTLYFKGINLSPMITVPINRYFLLFYFFLFLAQCDRLSRPLFIIYSAHVEDSKSHRIVHINIECPLRHFIRDKQRCAIASIAAQTSYLVICTRRMLRFVNMPSTSVFTSRPCKRSCAV